MKLKAIFILSLSLSFTLSAARYTVGDNGTPANLLDDIVTDTFTGLVWQRIDNGQFVSQAEAVSYCSSLSLQGSGWRVPTVKEAATLIAVEAVAFGGSQPFFTWTSTQTAFIGTNYWILLFNIGYIDQFDENNRFHARCVR